MIQIQKMIMMLLLFSALPIYAQDRCNYYQFNPEACINKLAGLLCYYDYFENKCLTQLNQNKGCSENLNFDSCINQLTDFQKNEVQCVFANRCQEVNQFHLQNLGCYANFNKYACLNANAKCKWAGKCEILSEADIDQNEPCLYNIPVTPYACMSVPNMQCYNKGFEGEYFCSKINDELFQSFNCDTLGITEIGCISITTKGQYCVYESGCKSIKLEEIQSCNLRINQEACLSIKNLKCQWAFEACRDFIDENQNCEEIKGVTRNVCSAQNQSCYYDVIEKSCKTPTSENLASFTCTTIGLSRDGCMNLKNDKCTYYNGFCEQMNEENLKRYICESDLNEQACLNITTPFQFCVWNGESCQNTIMNQDLDCPLQSLEEQEKINGNICQSISKKNVSCKYDFDTNLCIKATNKETCNSPFLNKEGCLNITDKMQACIWSESQCVDANVIQFKTTCDSLGFANPIACSQILENNQLGCYFNSVTQMCETLIIELPDVQTQELIQKHEQAKALLDSISCSKIGINRIVCASITTDGERCYWTQGQCKRVRKQADISRFICLDLQYANFQTCALVQKGKEPCRYFNDVKGCVNSLNKTMDCNYPGLNIYACSQVMGQCYYNNDDRRCQSFDENQVQTVKVTAVSLDKLQCVANSPSKSLCIAILTIGQLCKWSSLVDSCIDERVEFNQRCVEFSGAGVMINANVCASIVMDFPDYDPYKGPGFDLNRGYCSFNSAKAQCEIRTTACSTKCCTEKQAIGINVHSCSKFGSKDVGVYCYFDTNRCQQLTQETVDITNDLLVQQFFNAKKMTCNQMGKNSCHMINWSSDQLCFYNGSACVNLVFKYYQDYSRFIAAPAILNENVCLAIEAKITPTNKIKYFAFDPVNKFCKILVFDNEFPFATCEDAIGNRNVCLRYTGNNYCKWDPKTFKCITMSETEFMEINTCNYNQNIKSCTENKNLACQFQYDSDQCIDAPHDVGCSYFDKSGPVSEAVCKQITRAGQVCKYDNKKCVIMTTTSNSCILSGTNMIGCFKNTKGACRWDPIKAECYQNQTDISQLKCTDYLNQQLCLQIYTQSCYWDEELTACLEFKEITQDNFLKLNIKNKYNSLACFQITQAGYYFNSLNNSCTLLTYQYNKCTDYQMNQYACLFLTKGYKCYFDQNAKSSENKCKYYNLEQSVCQTKIRINLDVCMDIPQTCYFDLNTLLCVYFLVEKSTYCSTLTSKKNLGIFYNKLTCSAIDIDAVEPFGDEQCYQYDNFDQQCNYEKYCFWIQYGCQVYITTKWWFDKDHTDIVVKRVCTDGNSKIEYSNKTCAAQAYLINNIYYVFSIAQKLSEAKCTMTPDNTASSECLNYSNPTATIASDGVITPGVNNTQSLQNICLYSSKPGTSNECQQSYECAGYFFDKSFVNTYSQTCKVGVCPDNTACKGSCPDLKTYASDDTQQTNPIITPQTCTISNCASDSVGCFCDADKQSCKESKDCGLIITNPSIIYQKFCQQLTFFVNKGYCLIVPIKITKCENIYSKALCLQIIGMRCYFDIKQGGCKQYVDKETRIAQCDQFYNGCRNSYSQNTICKNSGKQTYPENCKTITNEFEICEEATGYNGQYQCSDISSEDAQPGLCSLATDDCRFVSGQCVTNLPLKNADQTYTCDSSFSKTLCEKCGCDYNIAGYCQQNRLPPQMNSDQSNKYYLCYEVNLRNTNYSAQNCGLVDQACRYNEQCEDATQMTCNDLIGFVTTYKACIKCDELKMRFDTTQLKCLQQTETISQCQYLNRLACLSLSRNKMCIWKDFQCQEISDITASDSTDCSIYNFNSCYKVKNLCWFDPDTQLCSYYESTRGECKYLFNEQTCKLSIKESCTWDKLLNVCQKNDIILPDQCVGLNKYGCLHHPQQPCLWSDTYLTCEIVVYRNPLQGCTNFYISQQAYLTHSNSVSCSRINVGYSCFLDQYYHCREAISTDILYCNTPGLNNWGCLKRTSNSCQAVNGQCVEQTSKALGCLNNLNMQACLNQNAYCQFSNNCFVYNVISLAQITSSNNLNPYSYSVCTAFDQDPTFSSSLLYSVTQGKALDVSLREPFIEKCGALGINKYACLNKTNTYCIYQDQTCQTVSFSQALNETECKFNYNWKACILISAGCKFLNNKCMKLTESDTCQQLDNENAIISSSVCLKTTDSPCYFQNNQCKVVTTPQKCSAEGLNYLGCIFNTKGSMCSHTGRECIYNYDNVTCDEKINEDKCLSIRSKSQFCTFDSTGCKTIDNSKNILSKCTSQIRTNPSTCALATDYPCFYDLTSRMCLVYFNPLDYSNIPPNYNWGNSVSFNQAACEQYNIVLAVRWQDGCTIVGGSQLTYLKCNQNLNRVSCISIKTPFQYCMYVNNHCVQCNLDDFKNKTCESIQDTNTGVLCSVTQGGACKYTQYLFGCESVPPTQIIECVETDPELIGYNKAACIQNSSQCFFDENCYKLNFSGMQFCSDVKAFNKDTCRAILQEGCTKKNNQCAKIYTQDYQNIQCSDAINRFGCVFIQTQNQFCRFDGENCVTQSVKAYKDTGCVNVLNVNHFSFCEQPLDVPCTFDQKLKSCRAVNEMEEFSCDRGLNQLACLNQTQKSLQCKFLGYCYGPNNRILSCDPKIQSDCCMEAFSQETCLFQKLYYCQWKNGKCQKYIKSEQDECKNLQFSSFQVCSSIVNVSCIFNVQTFGCLEISAVSCDEMQTPSQCSRIKNLPCVWDQLNEFCLYKEPKAYESCDDIDYNQGSERACTNVIKEGFKCLYENYHCINSHEQTTDNCKINSNMLFCLQQKNSACYWKLTQYQIKKFSDAQQINVSYGSCEEFTDFSNTGCNNNLSYLSCLKITQIRSFCIWRDGACQEIEYEKGEIYSYDQFALVNINVCGLVNSNQLVQYDTEQANCALVESLDQIWCDPFHPGLNKLSCLNIKNQNCIWEEQKSICVYQSENAIQFINECSTQLSYKLCAKVEGTNQPCAIVDNKCQQINLESVTCNQIGLNKFGCLNIKNYPCIWDDNQCKDYLPYQSCLELPNNVNSLVCQLVQQDACFYDQLQQKCVSTAGSNINCDSLGLNAIGCVQTEGCYYDKKCQNINKSNYLCSEFPKAHYKICQNAMDGCKYNVIQQGCSSTYVEKCDQIGISQIGCEFQNSCYYEKSQCQCKAIQNYYNQCYKIVLSEDCFKIDNCYFEVSQDTNLGDDYKQQLGEGSVGRCRIKKCEDLTEYECEEKIIDQKFCYLNSQKKCQSALQCEDIIDSQKMCEQFTINNKPCRTRKNMKKCETLVCRNLNESSCINFFNYCKFDLVCKQRECKDFEYAYCQQQDCSWNFSIDECQEEVDCSEILTSKECNAKKQNGRQCTWVQSENHNFCSIIGCRYLPLGKQCSGTFIGNEVCVELLDSTCVSCEEIKSMCQCLEVTNYCYYNSNNNMCETKNCQSSFKESGICPSQFCFEKEDDKKLKQCFMQCGFIYSEQLCYGQNYCIWQNELKICQQKINDETKIDNEQKSNLSNLLKVMIISYFLY